MKPIFRKQNSKFTSYWNYSVEEEYKKSINQIEEYLAIPLEEHIRTHIERVKRFTSTVKIDNIRDNQLINYQRQQQLSTASLVEYYDAFLCEVCSITGKKIPWDTEYYIQVIREDENDPEYVVYSLEGLKEMENQISKLVEEHPSFWDFKEKNEIVETL